jgi:hypothetical protein
VVGRLAALAQSVLGADKPQPPVSLETRLAQAVTAAVQAAAPRQGGLAPLMADLEQAAATLPPAAQAAVQRLLALRMPLGSDVTSTGVQRAVSSSGLFLEARMAAAAAAPSGAPPVFPAATDLKAALLVARVALARWAETAPTQTAAPHPAAPATPEPAARPAALAPAPPYRHGPTAGQTAAQASLAADAAPVTVARRLLHETEAAIARQELLQAASLPEPAPPGVRRSETPGHWLFEIPYVSPQGQGVAQFEVERDGAGGGASPAAEKTWRARFSIDLAPLGPLHAQLAVTGYRAGVTLWAEDPETAAQLREWQDLLAQALESADYLPDVAVMTGAPPAASVAAGAFVDRSS